MASTRYAAGGMEVEFQPGSRGRVLRNFLGITRVREMEAAETQALAITQGAASKIYGSGHRFTTADIRRLHRMWLGAIYPWAGNYRTVNIGKGGFQFAHAPLIPRLMARLGRDVLRRHTPCGSAPGLAIARSLAEVHAELILIHPFRDGNGRLARLIAVLMASIGRQRKASVCPLYPRRDEPRLCAARGAFRERDRADATRSFQYLTRSSIVSGQWVSLPLAKGCRMPSIDDDVLTDRYNVSSGRPSFVIRPLTPGSTTRSRTAAYP
jgi:cell filamentation protein